VPRDAPVHPHLSPSTQHKSTNMNQR
jgi:hypothetical protein